MQSSVYGRGFDWGCQHGSGRYQLEECHACWSVPHNFVHVHIRSSRDCRNRYPFPPHLLPNFIASGKDHRIDGCFLVNPAQTELPPTERRWVLFFGGNGELYEFALPELHRFAATSGLSCFAFNYRGVSLSSGFPTTAEDLAEDGNLCMRYLQESLDCPPENVLLFGHR